MVSKVRIDVDEGNGEGKEVFHSGLLAHFDDQKLPILWERSQLASQHEHVIGCDVRGWFCEHHAVGALSRLPCRPPVFTELCGHAPVVNMAKGRAEQPDPAELLRVDLFNRECLQPPQRLDAAECFNHSDRVCLQPLPRTLLRCTAAVAAARCGAAHR